MKRFKLATNIACGSLLMTGLSNASATVLDFNAQTLATNFGTITESGFDITGNGAGTHFLSSGGSSFCGPDCPNNGTNHLLSHGDQFDIVESSASLFSLSQFDGAETHEGITSLYAEQIRVVGTYGGGGTVTADFTLDWFQDGDDAGNDFQTFFLPSSFTGLSSVTFSGIGVNSTDYFSLDNVVLNSAVPVPAAAWLFGSGLIGLIGIARRKTSTV